MTHLPLWLKIAWAVCAVCWVICAGLWICQAAHAEQPTISYSMIEITSTICRSPGHFTGSLAKETCLIEAGMYRGDARGSRVRCVKEER
jgi:hypothetical protein